MNSPTVNFQETDLTINAAQIAGGISGVILKTKRGPLNAVNTVVSTWEQFKRIFGGFIDNSVDPGVLLAKRALEGGSALRVLRAVHYDDITDPDSYTAEFSIPATTNIFTLASALTAGHTISYNGGVASQVFDTSSVKTLQLLAVKMKAALGTIHDVVVISSTKIIVVPSDANITGDTVATSGSGAPAVTRTTSSTIKDSAGNTLFTLSPKYPGEAYDNLKITISAGSNGQTGYFDLKIELMGEGVSPEIYRNLKIPGSPTVADSHYLDVVEKNTQLVDVAYSDLSAISSNPIVPNSFVIKFKDGDDGDALEDTDYIGDSASNTGFFAFNGIDDIMQVAVLDADLDDSVHIAGAAYANARKDLQYFAHIEGETEDEVVTNKDALLLDSSYAMFFAGNIKVIDPSDSVERTISELGDVLGLAAYSEKTFGAWFSFSGYNRGLIQNSLGAANTWGSPGNKANLDILANHQINVVINRSRRTVLWGSFTGQLTTSQLSLGNVRRLHIFLKKSLGPVLEQFLEEPCDILMFKKAYLAGKSFLDPLIPARAMYDYRWDGDQFANSPSDFKVNNPSDIALGKYKVRLFVKDIASLQEFSIDITLTPTGISFEDAITLVQP